MDATTRARGGAPRPAGAGERWHSGLAVYPVRFAVDDHPPAGLCRVEDGLPGGALDPVLFVADRDDLATLRRLLRGVR